MFIIRAARSALLLTFATAGILAMSCRGADSQVAAEVDEVTPTFRGGEVPAFAAEVDQLRAQGIDLSPSVEVGAIPTSSGVDANGNATLSIPIDVAPGPRGMAPSLSLDYVSNDGAGNGNLGVGFRLSGFGSVRRCSKNLDVDGGWAAVELDNDDALCMDGMRLVLAGGSYAQNGSEYRTLRDPFARIVLHGAIGEFDSWFEVFHKDGKISEYGRVEATLAREVPGGDRIPYAWGLRQQRDRFGNAIHYAYDVAHLVDPEFAELRPSEISYGGTGTYATRRKVRFAYEPRIDRVSGYFVGGRYGHSERIERINVEGPGSELLFSYRLAYDSDEPDDNFLTRRSRLVSVTKCDRFVQCLPPTGIEWIVAPASEDFVLFRNAFAIPDEGGDPDPESAGSVAMRDAQIFMTQATNRLVGDFDGDLVQDELFWTFDGSIPDQVDLVHIWNEAGEPLAPYTTIPVQQFTRIPGAADILDGHSDPKPVQHRIGATMDYAIVNYTDDGMSDVLIPLRAPGNGLDAHGHPYAAGFRILLGHGVGDFDWVDADDGASGNIYQIVPTDHDGDGLTDLWLCRGWGYKTATWELAHLEPPSSANPSPEFAYSDTGVGCSAHDELQVLSLRGGPESLLVVPAYPTDPAQQLDPSDPDHTSGDNKIPEAQRTEYLELQYDVGGTGALVPSDLPRDVYQRWHDENCNNGYAALAGQPPVWGAGLGRDKVLDVNGDGLMDVLRFELDGGDVASNPDIFGPGFPETDDTYDGDVECKPDIGLVEGGQLVLHVNNGIGFEAGEVVHAFAGSAHANYSLNFVGAMVHDANEDGLLDVFLPSAGEASGDQWALLVADGIGSLYDPGFPVPFNPYANDSDCTITGFGTPCIWPAYRDDDDWMDQLALKNASAILLPRKGGTHPGVTFLGPAAIYMYTGEPGLAHPGWVIAEWESRAAWDFEPEYGQGHERIKRVTDGLGAQVEFGYELHYLSGSAQGESWGTSGRTRPAVVASRHTINGAGIPCNEAGAKCRTTHYEYGGAVVDRLGSGFLGFNRVTATVEGGRSTIAEYDLVRDDDVPGFPYAGLPDRQTERASVDDGSGGEDTHIVCTSREWTLSTSMLSGGVTYFAYPHDTRTTSAIVPGPDADCDDLQSLHEYRDQIDTLALDAFGTPTLQSTEVVGAETTATTFGNFLNDTTNWIIGRPRETSIESCTSSGSCRTRYARTHYNPVTGEPETIIREPSNSLLRQDVVLEYHPTHGALESIAVIAGGDTRTRTTTWDDEGVTPTQETNPEGHVTYVLHDPASGVRYAAVDPNGLTQYTEFDGMLRPVRSELRSSPMGSHDGDPVTTTYEPGISGEPWSALRIRESAATGQVVTTDHDPAGRLTRRSWLGMETAESFPPGGIIRPATRSIRRSTTTRSVAGPASACRHGSASSPRAIPPGPTTHSTGSSPSRQRTERRMRGATTRRA